jgi:hypothetical protein
MVKPGTFAGTLEDSTNPKAFQAFKEAEHYGTLNSLKGRSPEEITSILDQAGNEKLKTLHSPFKFKVRHKERFSRPENDATDRFGQGSKLDAMKALLEPDPARHWKRLRATESTKHEAFDYDGNMATDESASVQARTYLNTAFGKFTERSQSISLSPV